MGGLWGGFCDVYFILIVLQTKAGSLRKKIQKYVDLSLTLDKEHLGIVDIMIK